MYPTLNDFLLEIPGLPAMIMYYELFEFHITTGQPFICTPDELMGGVDND